MKVKFFINSAKPKATTAERRLGAAAAEAGLEVVSARPDVVIALGGDGTILRAVHRFRSVPVLGFNLGGLGYLSSVGEQDFDKAFRMLATGRFRIAERTMLALRSNARSARRLNAVLALNDIVIVREMTGHAAVLDLAVGGKSATRYMADGIVIATPTGSTAYSLSAGGPVLMPDTESLVITAMNPHALGIRPTVIRDSETIVVTSRRHLNGTAEKLGVYADGDNVMMLGGDESVTVSKAASGAKLVELEGYDPYETLSRKLGWGDPR
jgi:NAD+ kinase